MNYSLPVIAVLFFVVGSAFGYKAKHVDMPVPVWGLFTGLCSVIYYYLLRTLIP